MKRTYSWIRKEGSINLFPLDYKDSFSFHKEENGLICFDVDCVEYVRPDNFIFLMKEAISWAEQGMTSERD